MVGGFVIVIHDVLVQQLDVEDILIIRRVEAVVQSDECGVVDAVAAEVAKRILIHTQTAVVLHLHAQILYRRVTPEIKTPRDLRVRHERGVVRVVGVDRVVKVNERECVTPRVGVEQLQRRGHTL